MEDDDSNSNSSSNKSALDLRSLASAVRIKRAQEVGRVEKRQKVVIKRNDDSRGIWEQVKDFASRLVDELVKRSGVPMEIEALVRQRYNCKNNSEWLEDAISEFEDSDLKGLMPLYHGKKKDSIKYLCVSGKAYKYARREEWESSLYLATFWFVGQFRLGSLNLHTY